MKTIIYTITILLAATTLKSQDNPMARLAVLEGNWQGTAKTEGRPGQASTTLIQYEKVEYDLNQSVLLIHGTGVTKGDTVFQALGVISFDQTAKEYKFKSWLADGRQTDAWFHFTGENNMEWGFDVPGGSIKYVINNDGKHWTEKGYFSPDGNASYPFFNMELEKL